MSAEHDAIVSIVDDSEEIRRTLRQLIELNGLRCETYGSAEAFLESFEAGRPGCIILDVRMPGMSGLELQEFLAQKGEDLPVLILTGHADVPVALRAMKAGAFEFLQKPVSNQTLLEKVRRALVEDARKRERRVKLAEVRRRIQSLTPRERQVMGLVVSGKANKVIGSELGLSQKTIEVHRSNVMRKMVAHSLPELVRMAVAVQGDQEYDGGVSS
jgi:FixJ family two-component response regulator